MEPIFTLNYGEFAVADYLSKKIKNVSIFIPTSAQEKGIDLLLYNHSKGHHHTCTVQVKMSRTYYRDKRNALYPYDLWFNRFNVAQNADWFILLGIYSKRPKKANARVKSTSWDTIMLAFTNEEMASFMSEVKLKKAPSRDDKMFGFGFDDSKQVFQTRGYPQHRDMSQYLIEHRLKEIGTFKNNTKVCLSLSN